MTVKNSKKEKTGIHLNFGLFSRTRSRILLAPQGLAGRDGEQCFEPGSASFCSRSRSILTGKIKGSLPQGQTFLQQEFAPSDELPTGKDGAMFRTWIRFALLAEQVDSDG